MQGMTIAVLMHEQLSQLRPDSREARREAAALELRRLVKEARSRAAHQLHRAPALPATADEALDFVPRLTGYPYSQ